MTQTVWAAYCRGEWAPFFPRSVTGWHDEGGVRVKCFEGMVVDYKEGS
jgi:hypothetical protein